MQLVRFFAAIMAIAALFQGANAQADPNLRVKNFESQKIC
jgi:hypothetical protein